MSAIALSCCRIWALKVQTFDASFKNISGSGGDWIHDAGALREGYGGRYGFHGDAVDVDTAGYARFLTDGVVRARYRNSTTAAEPIVPGEVYLRNIDLWATSNVFKAGHQIRLYVSSSNFPRFNRNPNTGESTMGSAGMVKATQTIYINRFHRFTHCHVVNGKSQPRKPTSYGGWVIDGGYALLRDLIA